MLWKKAMPWLVIAALVVAALFLSTGPDRRTDSDQSTDFDQSTASDQGTGSDQREPTKPRTVADLLDDCSPFESIDGMRTLEFDRAAHTVTLREAISDERKNGALAAEQPKTTGGVWTADEVARTVVVELDGAPTTYVLVVPPSETQCILGRGVIGSADLKASWFGTPPATSGSSSD